MKRLGALALALLLSGCILFEVRFPPMEAQVAPHEASPR